MEMEKSLDSFILRMVLLSDMKGPGTIRTKEKCPRCSGDFLHLPRLGFICPDCQTRPTRFYIDLFYSGQRIRLFTDKNGFPLDSYERAFQVLLEIQNQIQNHTFDPSFWIKIEAKKFYVSTLLDTYLQHKIETLAPSYRTDFKRHLTLAKNFFGTKDVRELRMKDIFEFKKYLEDSGSLSPKTVKNILDTFKEFLNFYHKELEVIQVVPVFPKIEITPKAFRWLSLEAQSQIFNLIPDEHKPIFGFLMLTGCRPAEARALKCKDVNLENGTITISATFSGKVYREKRKGKVSKPVTIPIHPEMVEYIASRVKNNLPEAFLFPNPVTGRPYNKNALQKIWAKVREKAGLKNIRLYDATRHSVASNLISSGTSLFKVSRLLGHADVRTTERYAHLDIEALRFDLNKLSLKGTVTRPLSKENL
jgi:integrase